MIKRKKEKKYYSAELESGIALVKINESPLLANALGFRRLVEDLKKAGAVEKIVLDFSETKKYDSYIVALIEKVEDYAADAGATFEVVGLSEEAKRFAETFKPQSKMKVEKRETPLLVESLSRLGASITEITLETLAFVEFLGETIKNNVLMFVKPKEYRWKDLPLQFLNAGVNAFPITFAIIFLIGLISGYQGALQLSNYGADIYVADLVGVSIVRELAPLMTAIIVAGRSGSAFAAELGAMKVSEEIDALNSMGFDEHKFLVAPRVAAVVVAMPILTLFGDFAGVLGGLIAAISSLNITIGGYITETGKALDIAAVFVGLAKSAFFGYAVATVGCFKGLQARGGAESVGRLTTSSVVMGIFLIILLDAFFTYATSVFGI